MIDFIFINDKREEDIYKNWSVSPKFNKKDQFINDQRKFVHETYQGRKYRLVKKERDFLFIERVGRGFLGTLILVYSLILNLFSPSKLLDSSTKKLFMKKKRAFVLLF